MMQLEQSFERKLQRLRTYLATQNKDWLQLVSQRSLAWLTGMRTFINFASVDGCAEIWVSQDDVVLVANNIEAQRLVDEELHGLPVQLHAHAWFQGEERHALWRSVAADKKLTEHDVGPELLRDQSILDAWEQAQLRQLATETRTAVETVAREVQRGETEFTVAGKLASGLWERGIEPVVVLVAADERAFARRHPLPTSKTIDRYVMLVVCGRSNGLVVSVTRAVHFGAVPELLRNRQHVAGFVDATAIAASRAGTTLGAVLAKVQAAYAAQDCDGEWQHHHQGGLTGYLSRTRLATPGDTWTLAAGMAVAWNPSVAGSKSEDTCLVTTGEAEILTASPAATWPSTTYTIDGQSLARPDILVRAAVSRM